MIDKIEHFLAGIAFLLHGLTYFLFSVVGLAISDASIDGETIKIDNSLYSDLIKEEKVIESNEILKSIAEKGNYENTIITSKLVEYGFVCGANEKYIECNKLVCKKASIHQYWVGITIEIQQRSDVSVGDRYRSMPIVYSLWCPARDEMDRRERVFLEEDPSLLEIRNEH